MNDNVTHSIPLANERRVRLVIPKVQISLKKIFDLYFFKIIYFL